MKLFAGWGKNRKLRKLRYELGLRRAARSWVTIGDRWNGSADANEQRIKQLKADIAKLEKK